MTRISLPLEYQLRPSILVEGRVPSLFLFHGYGSNEDDLFSFASDLPKDLCIISARAPFAMEHFGHAWYAINFDASYGKWSNVEQAIQSRDSILSFIEAACIGYDLDRDNVSLLGFSQGTVLSYAVALSYPEKVKNLIALSGYIDEKLLTADYGQKDHSKLQVYASHGQVDMVIPPAWAQLAPGLMKKLGIDFIYEEFPVGHGVSPKNFDSFRKWLEVRI